jgi:NAD(P)-dependent dehydrogenase (short-subunit alcohol dehydrogenase family)
VSVILITGAGKGIGLATALHFARQGHTVYASLRNPDGASEIKQVIADEHLPITLLAIDVDDAASVSRGVAHLLTQCGVVSTCSDKGRSGQRR